MDKHYFTPMPQDENCCGYFGCFSLAANYEAHFKEDYDSVNAESEEDGKTVEYVL